MDLTQILSLLGVIAVVLFGVPGWLTYNRERRRRDLRHRLVTFRTALGGELKKRRQVERFSVEQLASAVGAKGGSEDVISWERTGEIPQEQLGRLLDVLNIPDWDYRVLALKYLSAEEVDTHVEPAGHRRNVEEILLLARSTWCLAGRYSNIVIPLVAAKSQSLSQFKDRTSSNYTYVDHLSDRDTLVELARLLARLYPYSEISLECSTEYPASAKIRPSVVVGGIGFPGRPNNEFALEVFESLDLDVEYSEEGLKFRGKLWSSQVRNGFLTRDAGLFARLRSPMDPNIRLFFVQGTHTRGVYGAAKAFCLQESALENHRLCKRVAGDRDFVAIFDVHVVGGEVVVPVVEESAIFVL